MTPEQMSDLLVWSFGNAIRGERERCAEIAEQIGALKESDFCQATALAIAEAIRNKE